jgi:hypothetical protein
MLAHLRTEAYPVYATHRYPPVGSKPSALSYERNLTLIEESKAALQAGRPSVPADKT